MHIVPEFGLELVSSIGYDQSIRSVFFKFKDVMSFFRAVSTIPASKHCSHTLIPPRWLSRAEL